MRRWRVPAAGCLAGLLLVALYLPLFHQPKRDEIAVLDADAKQLRAQQESLRREIKALEEVAAREAELTGALRLLESLIPAGLAQPALLLQLQAAADRAGVKLVSVKFGDPEVPKGTPESPVTGTVLVAMPLTVSIEGPYLKIADLLRQVEVDVDRAVLVGSVALTEAESRYPQLTGTWSGHAYALLGKDDPLLPKRDVQAGTAAETTVKP